MAGHQRGAVVGQLQLVKGDHVCAAAAGAPGGARVGRVTVHEQVGRVVRVARARHHPLRTDGIEFSILPTALSSLSVIMKGRRSRGVLFLCR